MWAKHYYIFECHFSVVKDPNRGFYWIWGFSTATFLRENQFIVSEKKQKEKILNKMKRRREGTHTKKSWRALSNVLQTKNTNDTLCIKEWMKSKVTTFCCSCRLVDGRRTCSARYMYFLLFFPLYRVVLSWGCAPAVHYTSTLNYILKGKLSELVSICSSQRCRT